MSLQVVKVIVTMQYGCLKQLYHMCCSRKPQTFTDKRSLLGKLRILVSNVKVCMILKRGVSMTNLRYLLHIFGNGAVYKLYIKETTTK